MPTGSSYTAPTAWGALKILVKIADDIPHAKLSHRGIEQIIRAHQIDIDEDTMDMMCEKILNAPIRGLTGQSLHTIVPPAAPRRSNLSVSSRLLVSEQASNPSPASSSTSSRHLVSEQASNPSPASSSRQSAVKEALKPSHASSSRQPLTETASRPSPAPPSRQLAIKEVSKLAPASSSCQPTLGRPSITSSSRKEKSLSARPSSLSRRGSKSDDDSDDDDYVGSPLQSEESDDPDGVSTAQKHSKPQRSEPPRLPAPSTSKQPAMHTRALSVTHSSAGDSVQQGDFSGVGHVLCQIGCTESFSNDKSLLDHYILGDCRMLSDPSARLQHCAYKHCTHRFDDADSAVQARVDHWNHAHARDAFEQLSTRCWTDTDRHPSLEPFMAPSTDFGGHDVLRYEYIGDQTVTLPASRAALAQYTATALEAQWERYARYLTVDTAYNSEAFSSDTYSFAEVVESFAPLVEYDYDLDESNYDLDDDMDDALQQSEAEATEDIHSSYNMIVSKAILPIRSPRPRLQPRCTLVDRSLVLVAAMSLLPSVECPHPLLRRLLQSSTGIAGMHHRHTMPLTQHTTAPSARLWTKTRCNPKSIPCLQP
ncbi:hypothetical protein KCU93_g441, partial [Aureobasidium melanogenum]